MSRIGKKLINIPAGVEVTVAENNHVTVKGPKGTMAYAFNPNLTISLENNQIAISRPNDEKVIRTQHGTTRALLNNMVVGVSQGFTKSLEILGVGYRAQLRGNVVVVNAGYSHPHEMAIPEGITVTVPTQTEINITGYDKQVVGQFAAEIREIRKPEPYKGKGIRYKGEFVRRKEGKKAK